MQVAHLQDLQDVFDRVENVNMRLNPAKCSFWLKSGKFLGYMMTKKGIEANPDQIQAIEEMPSPKTPKKIQRLT